MTVKRNSFSGIASGTALTVQNSALAGDPADAVVLTGTGVSVTVNTSADLTAAYDRGMVCNVNGQANAEAMFRWNHTALSTAFHRLYLQTFTSAPLQHVRLARGYSGTTQRWEMRYVQSTGAIALVEYVSGAWLISTNAGQVVNDGRILRIEWKSALAAADHVLSVYSEEATTSPLATTVGPAQNIAGTWDNTRYGHASGGTAVSQSVAMAAIGWSDTALLGPAVELGSEMVTFGRHLTLRG